MSRTNGDLINYLVKLQKEQLEVKSCYFVITAVKGKLPSCNLDHVTSFRLIYFNPGCETFVLLNTITETQRTIQKWQNVTAAVKMSLQENPTGADCQEA